MARESIVPRHDWMEPAHPSVVDQFKDLVAIYEYVRDHYQEQIDAAFDEVSREIGFVITTTIPAILEIGKNSALRGAAPAGANLQGTLFHKKVFKPLNPQPEPPFIPPPESKKLNPQPEPPAAWPVAEGTYKVYLIWRAALRLKLGTDWMEPAHFRTDWMEPAHFRQLGAIQPEATAARTQEALARVRWDVREPVHWFDPGIAMTAEEAVQIQAIDQVYPELHLVERVEYYRQSAGRAVRPEVMEPAHFRQIEEIMQTDKAAGLAAELTALLRRYGY